MTLTELIQQHAIDAANAGDFDAVAKALNASTVSQIDATVYTSAYLVKALGVDAYRILSATLAAAGKQDPLIADMHMKLNSTGLDFSDDLTQLMVDQLGASAGWPQQLITQVKEIGRWTESPYSAISPGETVTPEQCQAAWVKTTMLDWLENRRSNALSRIQSGEITSVDDLKKFVGE